MELQCSPFSASKSMPEHSNITFWVRSQELDVDLTMCVFVPESLPPSE
jgi:hypothetical protein